MIAGEVERRLRRFLLVLAALLFAGTAVELWLIGHDESTVQVLPYVLCGLGIMAVLFALAFPRVRTLWVLRVVMGVIAAGSLFGMYEHVAHNLAFELDIRPNATAGDVWFEALSGASPLMAPGILALAAILAVAATYYHPVLLRGTQEPTSGNSA